MRTIARRLLATMLVAFAVGHGTVAYAVPFEELSGGRRALYTAGAVAANVLPGASVARRAEVPPGLHPVQAHLRGLQRGRGR